MESQPNLLNVLPVKMLFMKWPTNISRLIIFPEQNIGDLDLVEMMTECGLGLLRMRIT